MPEIDKIISFNAFHVLLIILICNTIITNNWEYIINLIYYILNLDVPGFWFLILHITIAYIMLISLKIELGFHASIKFDNL